MRSVPESRRVDVDGFPVEKYPPLSADQRARLAQLLGLDIVDARECDRFWSETFWAMARDDDAAPS
jgi:hypothetical protein